MFILIFLAIHCLIWVAFSYAFRGKLNLDKRGKSELDNNKIVVGQTRLSGFAQNDLSNIDEASIEVFSCVIGQNGLLIYIS